jgi:hypothetical protein
VRWHFPLRTRRSALLGLQESFAKRLQLSDHI